MNPVTNLPYKLDWGVSHDGTPCVVSVEPYVATGGGSLDQPSVAEPRMSSQPGQPASYFNVEAAGDPNAVPSPENLANRPPSAQASVGSRPTSGK
jgi:hypothetical protein